MLIVLVIIYLGSYIFTSHKNVELLMNNIFSDNIVLKICSLIVCILLLLYILEKLLRYLLKKLNISNLKLKKDNIEIELNGNNVNESIFNKYIDELIYFFEVTNYNIVVFEDLDRFTNRERIFTKLRELNSILNNAETINKKIVFIYAVRDDIFSNEERTKFFDYIIPVIPVINNGNSKEKLIEMLKKDNLYGIITYKYISQISIYINDMRLLNNIYNEFLTYYEVIKNLPEINLEQLFSIIVYKNIYPEDFAKMKKSESIIDNVFKEKENNKDSIIQIEIEELEEKRNELKTYKEKNKEEKLKNIEELKQLIWAMIEAEFERKGYPIYNNSININEKIYTLASFLDSEDALMEFIKNGKAIDTRYGYNVTVKEIEDKLGRSIKGEIETINNQNKNEIIRLENDIKKIENRIESIKDYTLAQLLQNYEINNFINEDKQNNLLIFLLINGYINENYEDYLSYFYEGTLSAKDKVFVVNVNAKRREPFNYKLDNIDIVIDSINERSFKKPEILNFDLINYLLKLKEKYANEREKIFQQIINYENISVEFFTKYILEEKNERELFIKEVLRYDNNIWGNIKKTKLQEQEKRIVYLILKFADIETILKIGHNNQGFIKRISEEENFARYIGKENIEKVKRIIKEFEIKFNNIGRHSTKTEIFDFIIENNNYEINESNIIAILVGKYKIQGKEVYNANYSIIKGLNSNSVFEYINKGENINVYIREILLNEKFKINDNEENIIEILNDNKVSKEDKINIIEKQLIKFSDIGKLDEELWDLLIQGNKLNIKWNNILEYYEKRGFNNILVDYFNSNYQNLGNIPNTVWKNEYYDFRHKIINIDNMKLEAFAFFIDKIPVQYNASDIDEERVSYEKISLIIDKGAINFSINMYNKIRESYKKAIPKYISKFGISNFINEIDNYEYDSEDIENIILCDKLITKSKIKVIKNISDNIKCNSIEEAIKISEILLNSTNKIVHIKLDFLKSIIEYKLNLKTKLKLILSQQEYLNEEEVNELFQILGKPYSEIFELDKRPLLKYSEENKKIKEIIQEYKFIGTIKEEENGYRIYKKMI